MKKYSTRLENQKQFKTIIDISEKIGFEISEITKKRYVDVVLDSSFNCLDIIIDSPNTFFINGRSKCEYKQLTYHEFISIIISTNVSFFKEKVKEFNKDVEKRVIELLNKPVETTNEQPKKDLEILYKDQKNIQYPILYKREYGLEVQLTGVSISLQNDGTFFINDTTGG